MSEQTMTHWLRSRLRFPIWMRQAWDLLTYPPLVYRVVVLLIIVGVLAAVWGIVWRLR